MRIGRARGREREMRAEARIRSSREDFHAVYQRRMATYRDDAASPEPGSLGLCSGGSQNRCSTPISGAEAPVLLSRHCGSRVADCRVPGVNALCICVRGVVRDCMVIRPCRTDYRGTTVCCRET